MNITLSNETNTLYDETTFREHFLNLDFDSYLIDKNNNLVNSNEYYLQYKSDYIDKTNENLKKYVKLLKIFIDLSNNYNINQTKYSYTFVDKNEYNRLNKEIKNLVLEQRQLYNNFMKYIQFINSK